MYSIVEIHEEERLCSDDLAGAPKGRVPLPKKGGMFMSAGGLNIEVKEPEHAAYERAEKACPDRRQNTKKSPVKERVAPLSEVTAHINPAKCINCGTCREACPVDAIKENQRIICHSCPVCTEKPGLSPQRVEEVATECSCTTACPLHLSPQGYIGLAREEMYEEAFKLIWDKNPLPSVCGSVCHHPCETACKRGILVDNPMKIRGIKKYLSVTQDIETRKYKQVYDEKIAVIGAGPAGLTAGHYLAGMGYEVTIFESSSEAGGMLRQGIPQFRIRRELIRRDIERLEKAGLDIRLNSPVSKYTMENLRNEYDIVLVAAGTPNPRELQLPGWRLAGVMTAMTYMRYINHGMEIERHLGQVFHYKGGEAVIIGGGSVAVDAARTAVREGASKVTVVSLESGNELAAHPWEKKEAEEEGVVFIEGYSPVEYMTNLYPALSGVKFAEVTDFHREENGKIRFSVNSDHTMELKADWVVVAIGQEADSMWAEYQDKEDVFFAGDIAGGKCSVVDAMANGREAAIKIDAALRGREIKHDMQQHGLTLAPVMEKIFPYNRRKNVRPEIPMQRAEERINNFQEVEGVLTKEQLHQEVLGCLQCGYEAVDTEKCIACGMCQKLCPKGDVITMVVKGGNIQ